MIFSFSAGTKGIDEHVYSLHVPLVLCAGKEFNFEDQKYVGELNGLTATLEKHHHLYSLKVSAFNSANEAQAFLDKILASLRWVSLKYNLGIKFPKYLQEVRIYEKPIQVTEGSITYKVVKNAGWSAVDGDYDVDKLVVIPEFKRLTRWESGQITAKQSYVPAVFIEELQQCLLFPSLECIIGHKKLCLAIELYSAYSFEVTSSGKFVKLVTVLESLLPDVSIPEDAMALLNEAKAMMKAKRKCIKAAKENTDSIDHLISRLGDLSRQSIGCSITSYATELFEEFPDMGDSEEIIPKLKTIYNMRSRLLHDGDIEEETLIENIRLLSGLIPKILINLFLKYANEAES